MPEKEGLLALEEAYESAKYGVRCRKDRRAMETFYAKARALLLKTEPIVEACWVVNIDEGTATCSNCWTEYEDNGETISDYWNRCPKCGAHMRADEHKNGQEGGEVR